MNKIIDTILYIVGIGTALAIQTALVSFIAGVIGVSTKSALIVAFGFPALLIVVLGTRIAFNLEK